MNSHGKDFETIFIILMKFSQSLIMKFRKKNLENYQCESQQQQTEESADSSEPDKRPPIRFELSAIENRHCSQMRNRLFFIRLTHYFFI